MNKKNTFLISLCLVSSLAAVFLLASQTQAVSIPNPLGAGVSFSSFAGDAINAVMGVLGTITLAYITYGGFLWMMSGGNTDKVKKGRTIFIWSFLGLVVIFGGYGITAYVLESASGGLFSSGAGQGLCASQGEGYQCLNTNTCNPQMPRSDYRECVDIFTRSYQTNNNATLNCIPDSSGMCARSSEICCQVTSSE